MGRLGHARRLPRRAAHRLARTVGLGPPAGGSNGPAWEFGPPPTPPGWTIGPPDFVGVGTARCGTTWWSANLFAHPGVARVAGARKEIRYFERFRGHDFGEAEVEGYHRFFPRTGSALAGEWTPSYIFEPAGLDRLQRSAPATRILVLVRDPVERYWSHVHFGAWWAAQHSGTPRANIWVERGVYLPGLDQAVRSVGRDRVLLLQYERCLIETQAQLRRTYEFVGLDPDFTPPSLAERHSQGSGRPKSAMPADTRQIMTEFYRPHVQRLILAWPEIDVSLWPNFRDLA